MNMTWEIYMKYLAQSIICILVLTGFTVAGQATPIDERQQNQQERVVQGVQNGELTRRETRGLVKNQRHIARTEAYLKADGEFSDKERALVQHKQNKAGRRIYRQKHDGLSRD